MKRNLLLEIITRAGAVFVRYGRKHDVYKNPKTGIIEVVARHSDIPEKTAKKIIKNLS